MKKAIYVAIVLLTVTALASAQTARIDTGRALHDYWIEYQKASPSAAMRTLAGGFYMGYVLGIARVVSAPEGPISIPDGMAYDRILFVVGNYLETHPSDWDKGADVLVVSALREQWGVSKGASP